MEESLEFKTEKRKIKELIPYEFNPRQLSEKQHADLKASIDKFGLVELPVINSDGVLVAGHQRMKVMGSIYGTDHEVEVRIPNRKMTESEVKEYNIRSNKNTGSWDFDILANEFSVDDLLGWGFEDWELGMDSFDGEIDDDDEYTKKIVSPVYEPKNKKPNLRELTDHKTKDDLIEKIEKSKITEEEKIFLRDAANRHSVFFYEKIADYYAHADKEVQKLMEDSALVIIDFNKAVEKGFVQLVENMIEEYKS